MRQPLVTITSTAKAFSQWVSRSQRGWLALGEAVDCDMSGSRLWFVGAEYGGRKIAKSSRKVKLNVITHQRIL
jgi:hypothetical protein